MKITKFGALLATAAATVMGSASALADEPPNDVRLGWYSVFYHTKADDLSGPYVPAGVNLKAEDLVTLYAGYVRHLPENFMVELAFGWPPLSKVKGSGPQALGSVPYNGQVISSARWISPSLLLEYNLLPDTSLIQPYIGAGVNYTTFYDRDSTAAGDAASGGPTRLSLTSSVGPAVIGGLTFRINDNWHLHASYSWARVSTNLVANTDGLIRTTHIDFAPQALVISGGYSF
jgi:outer membrane protein